IDTGSPQLTGFCQRLAQYYAEFLSTDFKKQQLPKRRLETSDAQGRLVGIPLGTFPEFEQKLWDDLQQPITQRPPLTVTRGTWRSILPKEVSQAITAHIAQISADDLNAVVTQSLEAAQKITAEQTAAPELAFEQFVEAVRANLARLVSTPLLDRLDHF